ncbi:alkaline phosphatase family protein [Solimonas terrae]|uniref:phospholipase C n=1 Tax=Solimonas terrae TaxID=1396819 RepID=A0A6M2BVI8_9GAMM|nr:alkaline phosphatase family protein [Solimonas terrae]NGY06009.1 alkaline phosphatase family protein [Solimonas terrae]
MADQSQGPIDRTRRKVLAGIAATAGAAGLAACGGSGDAETAAAQKALPAPADSGIDHIVVVMMENRSFDHYFSWAPGANVRPANVRMADSNGTMFGLRDLAPDYQNCTLADPSHSYDGGRTQFNDGKMDGFLLTQPAGDDFPLGYYTAASLPFYKGVVENFTLCDRYHCGILGPTQPNRYYMHAGQTNKKDNSTNHFDLPTVWDALQSVGRTGRYYYGDLAGWAMVSLEFSGHNPGVGNILPFSRFLDDAASGDLADVTYVDPAMLGEGAGTSNDDHPFADIRSGQVLLNKIYDALRSSPVWDKTLLIINYDEWGGFYDHVPPPLAPVTYEEYKATGNDGRLGFRVPCMAIGPRARRGHIEKRLFDPNSILNMIAWRFGFAPLGARGATSMNFAYALDFDSPPNPTAPAFDVPDDGSYGQACSSQMDAAKASMTPEHYAAVEQRHAEHIEEWQSLIDAALAAGLKPFAT